MTLNKMLNSAASKTEKSMKNKMIVVRTAEELTPETDA